ncbi:hypothetical protein GARC_4651 [Paraglaciecola arctica BSs20135]|uniref:Uncharacterized protein n=1 Tax=Paraglaciecola arctica BSs20135 TaxID=493475 RepID=K6YXW2_9ALTE|nr:hypothetical protein GARC_4651 [Paraglaciecola arctica BSs20135]
MFYDQDGRAREILTVIPNEIPFVQQQLIKSDSKTFIIKINASVCTL